MELYEQLKAEGHNVALVTDAGASQELGGKYRPTVWDPGYGWTIKERNLTHFLTVWDGKWDTDSFKIWITLQDEDKLLLILD